MHVFKQSLELSFLSLAKHSLRWNHYTALEIFAVHVASFGPGKLISAQRQIYRVSHVLLYDLLKLVLSSMEFVLSTFDGAQALQTEDTRHFRNPFINKGSEVRKQWGKETFTACSSFINHMLIHHAVNEVNRMINDDQLAELLVWIGQLLALHVLDEQMPFALLWSPLEFPFCFKDLQLYSYWAQQLRA